MLVWAYAAGSAFDPESELPLTVFPEPCVYREVSIGAITGTGTGRRWRIAFESSSMAGCLAAARAGFAVAPVASSQLDDSLRALGPKDGVPPLPAVQFLAFVRRPGPSIDALVASVKSAGVSPVGVPNPRHGGICAIFM